MRKRKRSPPPSRDHRGLRKRWVVPLSATARRGCADMASTRGACCTYSVQCVHGSSSSTFDHGVFPRSMFLFNRCGVKVGTRDKQQAPTMRQRSKHTKKLFCSSVCVKHTSQAHTRHIALSTLRVCVRENTQTMNNPNYVQWRVQCSMDHANGKCQRRALWHSARAHRHTHNTPRDDTHRSHRSQSQSARDYEAPWGN